MKYNIDITNIAMQRLRDFRLRHFFSVWLLSLDGIAEAFLS